MNTLAVIERDLPEMRNQLVDAFPEQEDVIREAQPQVIVWGVARHFREWDTGSGVIGRRELYALAHLL